VLITLYSLTFLFNSFWFGDIASEAIKIESISNRGIVPTNLSLEARFKNEMHRLIIVQMFML
jgi:hypothetical protein